MRSLKNFLGAIDITNEVLDDLIFMLQNRAKSTYFTRNPVMGFKELILFSINLVKKSLQLELDDFFKVIEGGDDSIRKQSYSEARLKILPEAFSVLFYHVVKWFYNDDSHKKYRGYRLSAIDGSNLEINNSELLRNEFGTQGNHLSKVARALASGIYDIENDKMIAATIRNCKVGEREIAIELIDKMKEMGLKNDLILFDRGYPSKDFISFIEQKKIKYLMRVSLSFKSLVNVEGEDQIVELKINKETLKVRVLKFPLESGVTEILITNIFDETFSISDFKQLYFKRWGIEVKYNEIKNRLEIENFTGETPISIKQDFYATIYLSNMVALAKMDANAIINEKNKGKNLKYEYKVNTNILIGKLKNSLVSMLLEKSSRKRSKLLKKIMEQISRNIIPIRPGRSFVRRMTLRANKHPLNKKKAL